MCYAQGRNLEEELGRTLSLFGPEFWKKHNTFSLWFFDLKIFIDLHEKIQKISPIRKSSFPTAKANLCPRIYAKNPHPNVFTSTSNTVHMNGKEPTVIMMGTCKVITIVLSVNPEITVHITGS